MHTAKLTQRFWLSMGLRTGLGGWSHRLLIFSLVGVMTIAAPERVLRPAQAAILSEWSFDEEANQLEIMVQQGTQPSYSVLNQPARIVLDLPNTFLGVNQTQQSYSGSVRQVQIEQLAGGWTRIILEYAPGIVLDASQVQLQRVPMAIEVGPFRDRWVLRTFISSSDNLSDRQTPARFPPLQTPLDPDPIQVYVPDSAASSEEFGQPLPRASSLPALPVERSAIAYPSGSASVVVPAIASRPTNYSRPGFRDSSTAARQQDYVFLPAGTVLSLRYPGQRPVVLESDFERQEVLISIEAIRDKYGNLIAPEGTPVLGRFETNRRGSRFIARAITLFGRNVSLAAESERSREATTLEPGQIVQIRLKEALR